MTQTEPGTTANQARAAAGDIRYRKNASLLSDEESARFRAAVTSVMDIGDSRGYRHFASIHGLPEPGYCEHGGPLFLPWHRAYLYGFEQALQDVDDSIALPWWDWIEGGIPQIYQDAAAGVDNPLRRASIDVPVELRGEGWAEVTERDPGQQTWLTSGGLPSEPEIDHALAATNYEDFRLRIENLHNAVHVWTGGQMVDPRYAAFDPLFWAHHSMVDRLWWLWQLDHPGANPPRWTLRQGLRFFESLTVADTLDVNELGYDYAMAEILATGQQGA